MAAISKRNEHIKAELQALVDLLDSERHGACRAGAKQLAIHFLEFRERVKKTMELLDGSLETPKRRFQPVQ